MKIRTGDTVLVISGKDKGKTGQVLRVLENKDRIVVSDVNMRTRHVRATPQNAGEIVKYEASINRSNVMLIDPKTKKPTRVGYKIEKNGRKVRIAKKSGELIAGTAKAKTTKASTTKTSDKAETKEAPKKAKAAPEKKAFWKNMGFGSEVEAEQAGAKMPEDHSVAEPEKRQSNRSHQRGS